jgi:hypothetical protein
LDLRGWVLIYIVANGILGRREVRNEGCLFIFDWGNIFQRKQQYIAK